MKYNYTVVLERDGEKTEFNATVDFQKETGNYYGNGYHMMISGMGFEPMNVFDCRYDGRLNESHLNEFFIQFARDRWNGENGSAKLVSIEEIRPDDEANMVYMPGIDLLRSDFKTNLAYIRNTKRISQAKLAEISGVSVRMIQKYEIADKDINKAQAITVLKLAEALGVNVADLLENE